MGNDARQMLKIEVLALAEKKHAELGLERVRSLECATDHKEQDPWTQKLRRWIFFARTGASLLVGRGELR